MASRRGEAGTGRGRAAPRGGVLAQANTLDRGRAPPGTMNAARLLRGQCCWRGEAWGGGGYIPRDSLRAARRGRRRPRWCE